jgi:hypothetical protein
MGSTGGWHFENYAMHFLRSDSLWNTNPTDENTRFFTVPTTGAAFYYSFRTWIDPTNGLTLDLGHMLMAGENPGQSIAMVLRKQKLFGIQ